MASTNEQGLLNNFNCVCFSVNTLSNQSVAASKWHYNEIVATKEVPYCTAVNRFTKIRGRSRLERQDVFVLRKTSSLDSSLTSGVADSASEDSKTALITEQQLSTAEMFFLFIFNCEIMYTSSRGRLAAQRALLYWATFRSQNVFVVVVLLNTFLYLTYNLLNVLITRIDIWHINSNPSNPSL